MTGPFDTKDASHQRPPWREPGGELKRFLKRRGFALVFIGLMVASIVLRYIL